MSLIRNLLWHLRNRRNNKSLASTYNNDREAYEFDRYVWWLIYLRQRQTNPFASIYKDYRVESIFDNDMVDGEIKPPWVIHRDSPPWDGFWKQGDGEFWKLHRFHPFFKGLTPEERVAYVDKWEAPNEWRQNLLHPINPHRWDKEQ